MKRFLSLMLAVAMAFSCTFIVSADETALEITKQPTLADPTVEVNLTEDVTYQWYVLDEENPVVTVIDDTIATPAADTPQITGSSSYDSENEVWLPATDGEGYYEFFFISLDAGESIDVTFNGFAVAYCGIGCYETDNAYLGEENEYGSYTITAGEAAVFVLFADEADAAILTLDESTIYAQASFMRPAAIPLESETEKTLSEYEIGKTYFCEVTAGVDTVVSDYVDFEIHFTKQPTVADPSVELSMPDLVESYQWYVLGDEYTEAEITNANAATVDILQTLSKEFEGENTEIPSYITVSFPRKESVYLGEDMGWLPSVMQISASGVPASAYASTTMSAVMYFEIDVQAGSTVYAMFSEELPENVYVTLGSLYGENATFTLNAETGIYEAVAATAGTYYLIVTAQNADISNVYARAAATVPSYVEIEDETEDTLSKMEAGNKYYCAATLADGSVYYSAAFLAERKILQQPSAADPTFKVTFADDAAYKWFNISEQVVTIDDTMTENNQGTYDSETGEWTGLAGDPYDFSSYQEYSNRLFHIDLQAGETVKVTLSNPGAISPADPKMRFYTDNSSFYLEFDENGVGYFTAEENGLHEIFHYCKYPETTTLKFELSEYIYTEIEGETEKTLKEFKLGGKYAASATYEDGTELVSEVFTLEYAITKQPTADDLSVEVNFPDDVKSYEWFYVTVGEVPVTDENATATYYNGSSLTEGYYDSENGCWVPSLYSTHTDEEGVTYYEYDIFNMELKAGDTLVIIPSAELKYGNFDTWNENTDNDFTNDWVNEDGVYTLEITEDGMYWFYTYTYTEDITFEAYILGEILSDAIEGEDTNTLQNFEYDVTYVCAVTFKDGTVLYSDELVIEEPEYILGDVNADGAIDQYDYILVIRHYFGTRYLTDTEMLPADVNCDGVVDQYDYILIRRHYFGTYVIG